MGISRRQIVGLGGLVILTLGAVILRMMIDVDPGGGVVLAWPAEAWGQYRWATVQGCVVVGTALGVSGLLLQALLRNPLASPFILGVSGGAGLGVMVAMYVGYAWGSGGGKSWTTLPALAGAMGALSVVYLLGRRRGLLDPVTLILVGVVISTICGAGMMFFQTLVPTGLRGEFVLWLMGHISEAPPRTVLITAAVVSFLGLGVAMFLGRALDAAALGDEEARSVGLAIGPLRVGMFLLAGALAAGAVGLAGPIGFVGLIAPHAGRLLLGPRHTALVPGAALCGVLLLLVSDTGRQVLVAGHGRMPVGIFTALIGGPCFLWLLLTGWGRS